MYIFLKWIHIFNIIPGKITVSQERYNKIVLKFKGKYAKYLIKFWKEDLKSLSLSYLTLDGYNFMINLPQALAKCTHYRYSSYPHELEVENEYKGVGKYKHNSVGVHNMMEWIDSCKRAHRKSYTRKINTEFDAEANQWNRKLRIIKYKKFNPG